MMMCSSRCSTASEAASRPVGSMAACSASSVSFSQGVVYGAKTLLAAVRLVLHRTGAWPSRKYRP